MKIAIVNHVAAQAETLRRVLAGVAGCELLWLARDGLEAIRLCAERQPDLILMDLNLPGLDGVEATRVIMRQTPCAILIVTGRPQDNVGQVFRAMGAGALDVTATPVPQGRLDSGAELLAKIRTIGKLIGNGSGAGSHRPKPAAGAGGGARSDCQVNTLVAIGASTGGPAALARILAGWRAPADCAIVVVQHIDPHFADQFARWLAEQLAMPARVIKEGEQLAGGAVLIAKSNDHLILDQNYRLGYDAAPRDYVYRPSVDVFFQCVAQHWRGAAVGVLLSGMGRDGGGGLLALRQAGALTIAQDQASSAVYGMPRAAAELDAAQLILALDQIGPCLRNKIGARPGDHDK